MKKQTESNHGPAIPRLAYSIQEAADSLGISYISVFRLIQRGKLKTVRDIRNHLIPAVELQRFLGGAK
jgi:excisionase family DNA binding protein